VVLLFHTSTDADFVFVPHGSESLAEDEVFLHHGSTSDSPSAFWTGNAALEKGCQESLPKDGNPLSHEGLSASEPKGPDGAPEELSPLLAGTERNSACTVTIFSSESSLTVTSLRNIRTTRQR
jgi:hypothetical protein